MLLDQRQVRDFKRLINNYQPNTEALDIFIRSNFVVIAGPAGAGKDTLRNLLIKQYPECYLSVLSNTTRPMRKTEADGVDYHFVSLEEMKRELEKRELLQVALVHNQQISAMHVDEIRRLSEKQIGLSILVVQTEKELRNIKPSIKTVFLVPPSFKELVKRLHANRQIDKEEEKRRLSAAKIELEIALNETSYYCVMSDGEQETAQKVHHFLQSGTPDQPTDKCARKAILELLSSQQNNTL